MAVYRFLPLLFLFCLPVPTLADTSDWLQVQRFQQQLEKARGGDAEAMYDVARRYERGRGTNPDLARAAEWYRKCMATGKPACQARLGLLHFEGRGVPQDHRKALKLLRPAAEAGIPLAQYQLGVMYEYGTVVRQNRDLAMRWYRRALENGDYRAEQKLAQLRRQPATPPPAPTPPRPADRTRERLLTGNWLNGEHPATFLPSAISRCEAQKDTIVCTAEQERATDTDIITTRTEAEIGKLANGAFTVTYFSTVLTVKPKTTRNRAPIDYEGEDEEETGAALSAVKVGQRSRQRTLECRFLDERHIRCGGGTRVREFHLPDA